MKQHQLLLSFFFLFTVSNVIGQNQSKIDSLEQLILEFEEQQNINDWVIHQKAWLKESCAGQSNECWIEKSQVILDKLFGTATTEKALKQLSWIYITKAYYLKEHGKYLEAKEWYEYFLSQPKLVTVRGETYINLFIHQHLGNIYTRLGDYDKAETSLYLFLKSAEQPYRKAEGFSDLGRLYLSKGAYEQALSFYNKGLAVKDIPIRAKGLLLSNIADLYAQQSDYGSAINYADLALTTWSIEENPHYLWMINTYGLKGSAYAALKKGKLSEAAFKEGLSYFQKAFGKNQHNRDVAKFYILQGESQLILEENEAALLSFQKALNAILPSVSVTDWQENPNQSLFYPENAIVEALYGKIKGLISKYQTTKSSKDLDFIIDCYNLLLEAEHGLRQTYQFEPSKLISAKNIRTYSETVLKVLYLAYQNTKNANYAKRAFEIAEMTKAIVLKERLTKLYAQNNFLPSTLQKKDQEYQYNLLDLYQSIQTQPKEQHDSIYAEINQLRIEYDGFLATLSKQYPNYVQSKNAISKIDINQLYKKIINNQKTALIEYYWGNDEQYAFVLLKNAPIKWHAITYSSTTDLRNFRQLLQKPDPTGTKFQTYTSIAQRLYQQYINPLNLSKDLQKLVIIPDGVLYYLPFNTLLAPQKDFQKGRYDLLPYLGLTHQFSYSYSASILLDLQAQKRKPSANLLAFAPTFDNPTLKDLPYNKQEIETIQHFAPHRVIGKQATKSQFLENAGTYNFLHLATHAATYDETLQQSAIYFSDSALTLQDIYSLPLKAQLVVLSACETGTGVFQTGEGVMSLARAFMYQGCPSVVASLWNVNDASTATLMPLFYENLYQNMPKDQALQEAQKSYLSTASVTEAHPFYWSAFVLVGDGAGTNKSIGWRWILIILAFLLIAFVIYKKFTV